MLYQRPARVQVAANEAIAGCDGCLRRLVWNGEPTGRVERAAFGEGNPLVQVERCPPLSGTAARLSQEALVST